jgi:alpha-L-fucosidase
MTRTAHRSGWGRYSLFSFCLLLVGIILGYPKTPQAQERYTPSASNLEARRWFQDAKFGLFIHWGVYSMLGDGEWVLNNKKMPLSEYEKLPPKFNPVEFNAAEWVAIAKAAGMKYITITSKHHDGFAMFDSKLSDWDIVDRTPYNKDVLKALSDECHRQGIKLFFYYSQLDWHHPDYYPRGRTGDLPGRENKGDWNRYLEFMNGQLRELLTGYGEIGGIWFDGYWDRLDADWKLDTTYQLIHKLQPAALIGANHHLKPFPGEDFQMFEKDLPGKNTSGFNDAQEVGTLPLETCETINGAWGYNKNDRRFKSTKALVHYLARAAGSNANFLLNVGPMPDGRIQEEFVTRLREIGRWMDKHGESIYGTRGGPVGPRPWGVTTRKGNLIYLHILDWPDPVLALPKFPMGIKSAKFLKTGEKAKFVERPDSLLLMLPEKPVDDIDTVVVLEVRE